MWRFLLALKCFFLVLFARRLPAEARELLPPAPEALGGRALPPPEAEVAPRAASPSEATGPSQPARDDHKKLEQGAILILGLLQREGRLLDFLEENLDGLPDAQVGAGVREIHRGCKKALAEHVKIEPVLREPDNATVKVDTGFDPSRIRLVGNVVGQPPFLGTLRHPGWRGVEVSLPRLPESHDPTVIAPAEVEL